MLELRLIIALQHEVLLERIVEHETVLVAILGNMAHASERALTDGSVGDVLAAERDLAAGRLFETGERVDKLALAVAVDTGDADDLAAPGSKGNAFHGIVFVQLRRHGEVFNLQHRLAGLGGRLVHHELHRAADHHAGELFLRRLARVDGADVLALAQNGHAVGDLHDLVELVGDKEDALALFRQPAHDLHELFDLLRCEHGGRLVKDEDFVVAVEHFQDLHALLHADGDVLDLCVEIDLQSVAVGKLLHLLAGSLLLQKTELRVLRAEDDVVEHREHIDQLEVLVHHADVKRRGVVGVVDLDLLAVLFDDTLFRLIQAEENAHQRGLARAVLSQQSVDFALFQLQGDVIVCLDSGEYLGNVEHLDHILRRRVHVPTSLSLSPADLLHKESQCAYAFSFIIYILQTNCKNQLLF